VSGRNFHTSPGDTSFGRLIEKKLEDVAMIDHSQAPPTPEGDPGTPLLRPEARVMRADRSLVAMVLLVCTLGGMGIGFGSAMYLMRVQWGTTGCPATARVADVDAITWLGVNIRSFSAREGTLVLRVFARTAAERAGLRPGDVVATFDGSAIRSAEELVSAVRSRTPGDLVEIGIERDGRPLTLHARLGRR
jgi:hypothetical protein